jgi:hypothetical protein
MKDRRDAPAAAENIIPSSSGAARALAFIWERLEISGVRTRRHQSPGAALPRDARAPAPRPHRR